MSLHGSSDVSRKILIIDDEPDIVLYLSTLLKNNGYSVISTTEPLEAFDLAVKEAPDLICLDIMMPRKSGVSLFQNFKNNDRLKDIPVVIISGIGSAYGGDKVDFKKLAPGSKREPEAFFEKPVDIPRFISYLSSVLTPEDSE